MLKQQGWPFYSMVKSGSATRCFIQIFVHKCPTSSSRLLRLVAYKHTDVF